MNCPKCNSPNAECIIGNYWECPECRLIEAGKCLLKNPIQNRRGVLKIGGTTKYPISYFGPSLTFDTIDLMYTKLRCHGAQKLTVTAHHEDFYSLLYDLSDKGHSYTLDTSRPSIDIYDKVFVEARYGVDEGEIYVEY